MSGRSLRVSKLVAALAKAQGEIGEIVKNKKVTVTAKTGGTYDFRYATLSSIIDAIRKPLAKNGVVYTQTLEFDLKHNIHYLTTSVMHDEEYISSTSPLLLRDMSNQQFGSALTYMKRYALAAILGIAPDDDDDGNLADGNEIKDVADALNKLPKSVLAPVEEPKEDPITTGPSHNHERILVPYLEGTDTHDWMAWGKTYMAKAKAAKTFEELHALRDANTIPMQNMQHYAPKLFTNLSLAIVRLEKAMEKANAEG